MDVRAYEQLTGLPLKDSNKNWKGSCPVHDEKTPSFYIHKQTYLAHCFGCGASGYIDTLLSRQYNLAVEAVRELLGVPFLKPQLDDRTDNPNQLSFEKAWLAQFKRIEMHPFLKRRGFKKDIVMYHQARWDPEGRIVFPLSTLSAQVVGALGRTVKNEDPKWLSYWNGLKGNLLYQALDTLHVNIIVEGIFDVMWLNQHGYPGAAAVLGSKATKKQVELIKSNSDEVTLFLDNDEAGRIGQRKLARELGSSLKVYIAKYPDNKNDPQELTAEEINQAIDKRQTYIEYASSR